MGQTITEKILAAHCGKKSVQAGEFIEPKVDIALGNDVTTQMYGGVDALPTTFLIDRSGRVAIVHVGLASRKDIEDGVEQLLQSPVPVVSSGALDPVVSLGAK